MQNQIQQQKRKVDEALVFVNQMYESGTIEDLDIAVNSLSHAIHGLQREIAADECGVAKGAMAAIAPLIEQVEGLR